MGYVGLPIALAFARTAEVVGFDVDAARVALLCQGQDPSRELSAADFADRRIRFTSRAADLHRANFHIVAVPTPVDVHLMPDLGALLGATRSVGAALKPGDYVVYESTVFPGCTEEVCVPLLEELSGLRCGPDFKVGYSPERINPGDRTRTLANITKVVAGSDAEATARIAEVYARVVTEAAIHVAPSIKVAEAAKVIENTQRDLNIALMNELSQIFDRLQINTYDVLAAAGTKWNFLPFQPGLVGGHCIGVDPYYLTYKAQALGIHPRVILAGRHINDGMAAYVAKKTVQHLVRLGKDIVRARVLLLGVTFKEDVGDIRNSKAAEVVRELRDFGVQVDVHDPWADSAETRRIYGFDLITEPAGPYDAIVLAVPHRQYRQLAPAWFESLAPAPALLADLKGVLRHQPTVLSYWSL